MNEITKTNGKPGEFTPEEAFQDELEIKELIGNMTLRAYEVGLRFINFRERRGPQQRGYNSFNEWASDPAIAFGRATVYFYIAMALTYKHLLIHLKERFEPALLTNINIQKHRIILKALQTETNPDKLLEILHTGQMNSTVELIDKYGNPSPVLKIYGTFGKIVGKTLTITDILLPYDASNQNYYKELYGKRVVLTARLSDEPADKHGQE